MGTDYYITGYREMDGTFKKMLEIKKYCDDQGVSYPKEVRDYFGGLETETEKTIREEMSTIKIPKEEVGGSGWKGWEIKISDIPEECEKIRFWMGW